MKRLCSLIICLISCSMNAAIYEAEFITSSSRNKFVEVSVDGIKRRFAIDTGCSSLSINTRLLDELVKQKKVMLSDMKGEHVAQMANGYTHAVRELMINEFTIGGYTFRDVVAHVGVNDSPDAPLLLGQSLLERMRWYQISGNIIRFEPYDEAFQHALSYADYYSEDSIHQQEIANMLLPYERKGMLSCYFRQRFFYALYCIEAYDEAISLSNKLKEENCQSGIDITNYEIQLHYNQAVALYNSERYQEALSVVNKAWLLANSDAKYLDYISHIGNLYWHIHARLGNDAEMKEFEKFRQ